MLNDTCADCTALPAVVAVAGPQGLAGSISYQQGSLTLLSGTATVAAYLTSSSRIYLQKSSLQTGLSASFSLPTNLVVTKNVSGASFTVTSWQSICIPASGSIAATTGVMTVTTASNSTIYNLNSPILITGTLIQQTGWESLSTWYQPTNTGIGGSAPYTFTVLTSKTLLPTAQPIYNLSVFMAAFVNSLDNSTYDYVVIG